MASSQSPSSSTSLKASRASLTTSRSNLPPQSTTAINDNNNDIDIPIDTLVNHLLASKRSLSSINHVLTANDLATSARTLHEDVSLLYANTAFLRASVIDEAAILVKLRRSLQGSYDWGKREFKRLVRTMDEADGELGDTMAMLRGTVVGREIWDSSEEGVEGAEEGQQREEKNLLDFVDEAAVEAMREAMKKSIEQLQTYQQSFDGDLLRFDNDIRALKKAIVDSPSLDTSLSDPDQPSLIQQADHLLDTITEESSHMAVLLTSLTKHFDMCVTAIRTTEGAAALAKRRVKEVKEKEGGGQDAVAGVSISGVIAEQEKGEEEGEDSLVPDSQEDRREMMRVVTQDAEEVEDVVAEITERLGVIQDSHHQLTALLSQTQDSHHGLLGAFNLLLSITTHLPSHLASETYFLDSYSHESCLIDAKLEEMSLLREFYEGYASSFAALLLERERRKKAEERVRGIWKKARREVEKVTEEDEGLRAGFREEAGGWLPGDLWKGLGEGARRWEVVEVDGEGQMGRVLER